MSYKTAQKVIPGFAVGFLASCAAMTVYADKVTEAVETIKPVATEMLATISPYAAEASEILHDLGF